MGVIFVADIILAVIAIIWLFVAVMQDIKKREVANWLNFSLVMIALAVRAIASIISWQAYYFLYGLLAVAIFFVIANIFYYARIFAGGDAKLLIGLAAAFATTPRFISENIMILANMQIPFLVTFIINVLFVGSVYGIFWSVVLALTHFKAFKMEYKKTGGKIKQIKIVFLGISVLALIITVILRENFLLMFAAMFLVFPYLLIFVKAVENSCMIKKISVEKLTEGDWLFKPVKIGKKIIKPRWEGLSRNEIALIKRAKIKEVRIKQGLPFVPVFLIALLISFFTNLLMLLVEFFI